MSRLPTLPVPRVLLFNLSNGSSFFCSGKAAKWAGISVGGDRNHLLLWTVLPICPASKSTLLMMGRCEKRHLLLIVRTSWFYSTWKFRDWELMRIVCQCCRKTMVDSRLQVFGAMVKRCSWCGTCAMVESGPMYYFLHLFIFCSLNTNSGPPRCQALCLMLEIKRVRCTLFLEQPSLIEQL